MPVITPQFEMTIENAQGTVYRVPAIKSLEIKTSRKHDEGTGDTAKVELPSIRGIDLETFRQGDLVQISLGHKEAYDPPESVFLGVITKVGPILPVSFEAEDFWRLLRNLNVLSETEYQDARLVDIADDLSQIWKSLGKVGAVDLSGVNLVFGSTTDKVVAGKFYTDPRLTVQQVFAVLLKRGWDLFFLPGTKEIYFGPPFELYIERTQDKTPVFRRGLNIINSQLEFIEGETIKKVIVWGADSDEFKKRIDDKAKGEYEPGEPNPAGKTIEVVLPDVERGKEEDEAQDIYNRETKKNSYTGRFRTFGLGFFKHSMKLKLEMLDSHDGHDGHYFADKVSYHYSAGDGFKMDVFLDKAKMEN